MNLLDIAVSHEVHANVPVPVPMSQTSRLTEDVGLLAVVRRFYPSGGFAPAGNDDGPAGLSISRGKTPGLARAAVGLASANDAI